MRLEILLPHIQFIFQLLVFRVLAMLATFLMVALHFSEVNGLSELPLVLISYIDESRICSLLLRHDLRFTSS